MLPTGVVGFDPVLWFYFAHHAIWAVGFAFVPLCACLSSESFSGGFAAALLFLLNMKHISRIERQTNQRENWGIPLLLVSLTLSSCFIRRAHKEERTANVGERNRIGGELTLLLGLLTGINGLFILSWQLTHFLMMVLSCCWYGTYLLGYIERRHILAVFSSMACSLVFALMMHWGGTAFMHINSLFAAVLCGGLLVQAIGLTFSPKNMCFPHSGHLYWRPVWVVVQFALFLGATCAMNTIGHAVHASGDASHIFEVLLVNMGIKKSSDYNVQLYTNMPAFRPCPKMYYEFGMEHLVLPLAATSAGLIVFMMLLDLFIGPCSKSKQPSAPTRASFCPPDLAFLVQVWIAFMIIAALMLRFLALAGPICCIMAGLLLHSQYIECMFDFVAAVVAHFYHCCCCRQRSKHAAPETKRRTNPTASESNAGRALSTASSTPADVHAATDLPADTSGAAPAPPAPAALSVACAVACSVDLNAATADMIGAASTGAGSSSSRREGAYFSARWVVVMAIQLLGLAALLYATYETPGAVEFQQQMHSLPKRFDGLSLTHSWDADALPLPALTKWLYKYANRPDIGSTCSDAANTCSAKYRPIITGDMVTLSSIRASTNGRFRITSHPQYETEKIRGRNRNASQIFGKRTDDEISDIGRGLGAGE
jgi:hypothetical protein